MNLFSPRYNFSTTAAKDVELTLFRQENRMLLHAVHMTEDETVSDTPAFAVSVRTDKAPNQVLLAPEGTAVPFTYQDGVTTFNARPLHIYDLYLLEL